MYVCMYIYVMARGAGLCGVYITYDIFVRVSVSVCVYIYIYIDIDIDIDIDIYGGKTNRMRLKLERLKLESHHHLKHLEMLERELAQWGKIKIYKIKI